jgi:pimeloyl-ACP methyl ester carboxylesterase
MNPIFYRKIQVDGLSIFYRKAGPKNAGTLLLLHGLPSSSRMFEPLFARLSDRYHLMAPDYPGFGHSDWPDPRKFAYTFDHLAETMDHFTEALGLSRYTLYMQDYGGPVGFRVALEQPERSEALDVVKWSPACRLVTIIKKPTFAFNASKLRYLRNVHPKNFSCVLTLLLRRFPRLRAARAHGVPAQAQRATG